MAATHKSRSKSDRQRVEELRLFFAWLLRQITRMTAPSPTVDVAVPTNDGSGNFMLVGTNVVVPGSQVTLNPITQQYSYTRNVAAVGTHNLVGNKAFRRKTARGFRSFTKLLEEGRHHAPALRTRFDYLLQELRDLRISSNCPGPSSWLVKNPLRGKKKMRVWRDLIGVMQATSLDEDRRYRERETELHSVAWIVAPFVSADHPYDSITLGPRREDSVARSARRAADERRRRFLQRLDDKKRGLLVWKYLEEFRRTKLQNKFPPLEEYLLGAPTEAELESLSEMCRARRRLKLPAPRPKKILVLS